MFEYEDTLWYIEEQGNIAKKVNHKLLMNWKRMELYKLVMTGVVVHHKQMVHWRVDFKDKYVQVPFDEFY